MKITEISQFERILKKIENYFYCNPGGSISYYAEYNFHFIELLRSTNNLSTWQLENVLIKMKEKKLDFTHKSFQAEYAGYMKSQDRKNKDCKFYVPLNHKTDIKITLNGFKITRLTGVKKSKAIKGIEFRIEGHPILQRRSKIIFSEIEIYLFQSDSFSSSNVTQEFYSTFDLYKGILEYSYHRYKWKYESYNLIKNLKEFSVFIYPPFVYIEEGDRIDCLVHEEYPYDFRRYTENIKNIGNRKYFEKALQLISSKKLDTGIRELLNNCFRLYQKGIDIPYIDQSFLFFWNVLEKIALSPHGKTEDIINKIQKFHSEAFWADNINSINYLRAIRNDKVHRGIDDISIFDLNLLKYLCDNSMGTVLGNPPRPLRLFKTKERLRLFLELKNNECLDEIKEVAGLLLAKKYK